MNIGVVGLIIVFAVFLILLVANPRLSCFGRKLSSPFYPLFRRKRMEEEKKRRDKDHMRNLKTEDYGFTLDDSAGVSPRPVSGETVKKDKATDDYGLKLD